jgi:hypothetical protein
VLKAVRDALRVHSDDSRARTLRRFFKTGPGEYGEGDEFLGVRVPAIRRVAIEFRELTLADTLKLLQSKIHEERFLALTILKAKYEKGTPEEKEKLYGIYLDNRRYINNWDLVDTSAEHIIGAHLNERSRKPLYGGNGHTIRRASAGKAAPNIWPWGRARDALHGVHGPIRQRLRHAQFRESRPPLLPAQRHCRAITLGGLPVSDIYGFGGETSRLHPQLGLQPHRNGASDGMCGSMFKRAVKRQRSSSS